jgi:hypothetical protein
VVETSPRLIHQLGSEMEDCLHQSNRVLTIPIPVATNRGRRCGDVQRYAVVGVQGEVDLMN